MKIPSIGPETKLFRQTATKADLKSRKDYLLANHLILKDRVTISPDARIPDLRKRPAPPAYRRPGPPSSRPGPMPHPPPRFRPIPQLPPFIPPEDGRPRIPEEGLRVEPPPSTLRPVRPHPGIGPPSINPSDDFTIPEELLESIKQGIADKLSVPVEEITVIDQKQVSWTDTSLGNPQPGQAYAQMIVEGYKITVQVGEDKQAREFYAAMGRIIGPDPFGGQPPVVTIPEYA